MSAPSANLDIVVVGASGHLARTKLFPALFSLFSRNLLPRDVQFYGYARTALTDDQFRARVSEHLTCRYTPGESCGHYMQEFLARCHYVQGEYGSADGFLTLFERMRGFSGPGANRIFDLAVPPGVFLDVARALGAAGLVTCGADTPWSRVVIEKPFGKDRASSDQLVRGMGQVFGETQTYRIDHYLGKEVIQNLLVLRFANLVFEPLWNRDHIRHVEICWKEGKGVEGRGGYFDEYGIVRDVMQNHLLQMLALVAMEPPEDAGAAAIQRRKAELLRSVVPAAVGDTVLGQYAPAGGEPGYLQDPTVPPGSRTPTFAATVLRIGNDRWHGVPFVVSAGKGLDRSMTEIRVRFRDVAGAFCDSPGACPGANELVVHVQPDESIHLRIMTKVPGLDMKLEPRDLDLRYRTAFSQVIPDAYEALLLDVVTGDKSMFIGGEELAAAWDVFTPLLHAVDKEGVVPESYGFGSEGPASVGLLLRRHGIG